MVTKIVNTFEESAKSIEEAIEQVDQTALAESLSGLIKFEMCKDVLVKPLEPVKVMKEFEVPVEASQDEDKELGVEVKSYETTKKEIKEVESNFAKGIVLKMPPVLNGTESPFNIGDTVIFNGRFAIDFDLLKDSKLIKPYDIVAVEK